MKKESKLAVVGLLASLTASLCCFVPLIALVAGTSMAVSLVWLESLRPYLIGSSIAILLFAWYLVWKRPKKASSTCSPKSRYTNYFTSRVLLGLVSLFVVLMIGFPYRSKMMDSNRNLIPIQNTQRSLKAVEFTVEGMTCPNCEDHINNEVAKLPGIGIVTTSFKSKTTWVEFDSTQTRLVDIQKAILRTGYKIVKTH